MTKQDEDAFNKRFDGLPPGQWLDTLTGWKAALAWARNQNPPICNQQDINNLLETLDELAESAYFSGDREVAQRAIDIWEGKA